MRRKDIKQHLHYDRWCKYLGRKLKWGREIEVLGLLSRKASLKGKNQAQRKQGKENRPIVICFRHSLNLNKDPR